MRYLLLTLAFVASVALAIGCTEERGPVDPDGLHVPSAPGETSVRDRLSISGPSARLVIQPKPWLENQIFFKMDENVTASSTLALYPQVTDWRIKVNADVDFDDYVAGYTDMWNVNVRLWGYDVNGVQVASGTVDIDWADITNWYSTVVVSGTPLGIEPAGELFEMIADDLETQGPGKTGAGEVLKAPCWWKFTKAAAAVLAFVTVSGAALTACGSLGGPVGLYACITSLLGQGIGIGVIGGTVLDWLCNCWDGYREANPELCEGW